MSDGSTPADFDRLWNFEDPAGTEQQFRALLPKAEAGTDSSYLAVLLTQIARTEGLQRRFEDAHRTLDRVEPLLARTSQRARVRYLLERGRAYNSAGEVKRARAFFLDAWDLGRQCGEDFYAVDAAHMMAIIESPEEQLVWADRAIEEAEASDEPGARGWLGSLYNNLGWTYHSLGRYEEALATFAKGREWQETAGREKGAIIAAWTVGRALRSLGRYQEALDVHRANLERLEAAGDSDGYTEEEIGECLLAMGREDEARPHFARAFTALKEDPWLPGDEPERLRRLGELGGVVEV